MVYGCYGHWSLDMVNYMRRIGLGFLMMIRVVVVVMNVAGFCLGELTFWFGSLSQSMEANVLG